MDENLKLDESLMPETDTIQVMGRGANVDFTIDDTVPFETAERNLRDYLSRCRGLYSKGTVSVNVGRRILAAEQLSEIKRILDRETGLTVSRYWCPPEILEAALAGYAGDTLLPVADAGSPVVAPTAPAPEATYRLPRPDAPPAVAEPVPPPPPAEAETDRKPAGAQLAFDLPLSESPSSVAISPAPPLAGEAEPEIDYPAAVEEPATVEPPPGESGGVEAPAPAFPTPLESVASVESLLRPQRGREALIIKTTCRSGEVINYPGDVVVLADVNPGAQIIAGGDIVVLGALRGMAHAGADGDLNATIFALNLESHRLQIGPYAGEAPASVRRARSGQRAAAPKIAYLRRRSLYVAPFRRWREEYQGGILYEG